MKKIEKVLQNGYFLFLLFLLIVIIFTVIDFFNFDEWIYRQITGKKYYDIIFWDNLNMGSMATLSAVILALYSSHKSIELVNKQLEIEQQPLVVVENNVTLDHENPDYLRIMFKNIGRGPALRITANFHKSKRDTPFFHYNESHSFELGANTSSSARKIDEGIYKTRTIGKDDSITLFSKDNPLYIHIYYEDQLGNQYHRKAKFFTQPEILKLIETKNY